MLGTQRGTIYGYSLWAFEVYGTAGDPRVLTSISVSPVTAEVIIDDTQTFTATGLDQYSDPIAATINWTTTAGTGSGTIDTGSGVFTATTIGSVTVTATDTAGGSIFGEADVTVVDTPTVTPGDLALEQPAFSSSTEFGLSQFAPASAVDGNGATRWSSDYSDDQWIYVDLGAILPVSNVILDWEGAYGKAYKIQVSTDATNWTTEFTETNGNGGIDNISFATINARYVRMLGTQRGTIYGYSLWAFEVYSASSCDAASPTNHKQNLLDTGSEYYIDETYTLSSIPAALTDGIWVLPSNANAERTNSAENYIEFTVDRPVMVYVAYDAGASSLPNWLNPALSGFTDTFLDIQTTDPVSSVHNVYSQAFSTGTVSLGGNMAAGANGADSNYLVIVVEQ